MSKKIANIAARDEIEREFDCTFLFPSIYQSQYVIDGSDEATIAIITSDKPKHVSYAIWGILPEDYEEEWKDFQYALDTVSVPKEKLRTHRIFEKAYESNRCLIIVTGFYAYHLFEGVLYPYYVYHKSKEPFALAGIYNVLEDGFITCSLLKTPITGIMSTIQNVETDMPIAIPKESRKSWLDREVPERVIQDIMMSKNTLPLRAHSINRDFFKNGISYESMLEPVQYDGIPSFTD